MTLTQLAAYLTSLGYPSAVEDGEVKITIISEGIGTLYGFASTFEAAAALIEQDTGNIVPPPASPAPASTPGRTLIKTASNGVAVEIEAAVSGSRVHIDWYLNGEPVSFHRFLSPNRQGCVAGLYDGNGYRWVKRAGSPMQVPHRSCMGLLPVDVAKAEAAVAALSSGLEVRVRKLRELADLAADKDVGDLFREKFAAACRADPEAAAKLKEGK